MDALGARINFKSGWPTTTVKLVGKKANFAVAVVVKVKSAPNFFPSAGAKTTSSLVFGDVYNPYFASIWPWPHAKKTIPPAFPKFL